MKLLLAFSLLIGAIPVLALGLFSYYIAAGDAEQKTKESHMQLLSQTQMRIEQSMKTLELTAIQFANSQLVTSSLSETIDVTDLTRIRNLYTGLYNLQTLPGINEGYLVDLQHDWLMSFTSVIPLSGHPLHDDLAAYAKRPNNMFWDTGYAPPTGGGDGSSNRSETIRMVQKLPILPFTQQPRGFLIIEMLKTQFRTLIAGSTEQLGRMYILDRDGVDFLAKSDQEVVPFNPMNALISERIRQVGETSGFLHGKVSDKDMVFSYVHSPYNGWTYVYAISLEEMTRQTRKIAVGTVVACSVVFLVVGLLAWIISNRMYSPIRRLNEMTQAVSVGVSGGKDEFSSLEERFRTLFSAGQQMKQQMQDQFSQLKEFLMLKLFAGQLSESGFAHRSKLYGFPTEWSRLAVLTLQIDTLQDTRYRSHDRELLLFAIHNIASELIPAHLRFSPVLLNQYQVTLVKSDLTSEVELKEYYYGIAELIKTKVQEFLQVSVSIGISRPFTRTSDAVLAYNESLEALKSRIYLGHGMILHYEDAQAGLSEMAAAAYTQLKWTEDQLVQALKLGGTEKAIPWLDTYISELTARNVSINEYPVLMMQLVSRLYQIVQEKGGTVHHVLGESASYSELMKLNTLEDIADWFKRDLLEPIGAYLNRQAESQYVSIANKVIQLVEERYNQDITLEGCAAELNFHPVYLSRVFKKETGMTFSEYVSEYRMRLAKEWLETTTMKISDISDKLNYSNTTAFIRIFRKVVGMTPGQYRERNGQHEV
ncbi:helix-turn-helix domain-containing protein [Paenibacillus hamazuiensis]|uniref:helix-turn-helix domain-containing protein n=1 Tax=Paenibacillus hamazuiensis TaxID=2936508 RepID=UPI00200E2119|nr:helix-turn-helix domain-containing protein [Paenibacillus hamazuiensis]